VRKGEARTAPHKARKNHALMPLRPCRIGEGGKTHISRNYTFHTTALLSVGPFRHPLFLNRDEPMKEKPAR